MNEFNFEVKEVVKNCDTVIKVIGVGGCGSNMVNRMLKESKFAKEVELVVANTDIQDLIKSEAENKIQLGKETTGGRGAGAKPEVGLASALEAEEEIKECVKGANMVFLATGLGGGTGTGAAPVMARIAKESGALVVGVATMPFAYERRDKKAKSGLEEFKKECDCIILINNESLGELAEDADSIEDCLKLVDNILLDAVDSVLTILLSTGNKNVDFSDMQTTMHFRGFAQIGSGVGRGENAMSDAINSALNSPLLDSTVTNRHKAKSIILFVRHGEGIKFKEYMKGLADFSSEIGEDVEFFEGQLKDPELAEDEAHVILVITGFEDEAPEVVAPAEVINARVIQPDEILGRVSNSDIDYKSNIIRDEPAFRRMQQD